MTIDRIANNLGFFIESRVATESDEAVVKFKAKYKKMSDFIVKGGYSWAMESDPTYKPENELFAKISEALKTIQITSFSLGLRQNKIALVYYGMKIARQLGQAANVELIKIPNYVDDRHLLMAHPTRQPSSVLKEDYESSGPLTRACANYLNQQASHQNSEG